MNVSPYTPDLFLSLPNFQTARRSLERTRGYLKELGSVICRYGLQEHIGISLLHKHFSISPDEQLIKHFVGNSAYIRPYSRSIDGNVVPYLWKFEYNQITGVQSFYPLEFVDTTRHALRGRVDAQKFVSSDMFLAEISTKLCELNLENIFGLCTLHGNSEIMLSDQEMLLEATDHVNRMLTLAPATKTLAETTETSWQFTFDNDGTDVANCQIHCQTHCTNNHQE
jgi:hypothetical protein